MDFVLFFYIDNKRNFKIRVDWKREKERKKKKERGKKRKILIGLIYNDVLLYFFWKVSNWFIIFIVKIKNNNEFGGNKW